MGRIFFAMPFLEQCECNENCCN